MIFAQNITASMNNSDDKDIRPSTDTCPSCKSDLWNSAVKAAMEGTTDAKIPFTATAKNAGKLCGGVKEALLSDRWFSWAHPIEADIGMSTSTGLVQEVKRFMVEYGPAVQMPPPPTEPNLSTSITNMPEGIAENPSFAQAPTEPTSSGIVEEPVKRKEPEKSTVRSRLVRLLMVTVPSMVGMIGAIACFGKEILAVLPVLLIFPLIMKIATFKAHIRNIKMVDDEDGLRDRENRPETLEHYAMDRESFQEEVDRFRIRHEESERKLSEYGIFLEKCAFYEQQLAEYERKKLSVLKTRELLWKLTRLCTHCGTAYLGPG
jgi:hypothetical protein